MKKHRYALLLLPDGDIIIYEYDTSATMAHMSYSMGDDLLDNLHFMFHLLHCFENGLEFEEAVAKAKQEGKHVSTF